MVPPDATIDITSTDKLLEEMGIKAADVGSIQAITTSDGFTDACGDQNAPKAKHEDYLLTLLQAMTTPGKRSEEELATALVNEAKKKSRDNVSVSVTTILAGKAFIQGVYDGHGGKEASLYVAKNLSKTFKEQCILSPEAYAEQPLSVNSMQTIYKRDNTDGAAHKEQEAVVVSGAKEEASAELGEKQPAKKEEQPSYLPHQARSITF